MTRARGLQLAVAVAAAVAVKVARNTVCRVYVCVCGSPSWRALQNKSARALCCVQARGRGAVVKINSQGGMRALQTSHCYGQLKEGQASEALDTRRLATDQRRAVGGCATVAGQADVMYCLLYRSRQGEYSAVSSSAVAGKRRSQTARNECAAV